MLYEIYPGIMKQIARILTAIVSKGIAHQASKKVKEKKEFRFAI